MVRFIHLSDVHLGRQPDIDKVWSEQRAGEIETAFESVINICNMREIDLLLIAGDLFDAPPTVKLLDRLNALFSRLQKTRTVIISGANDYIAPDSEAFGYRFNANAVLLPPGKPSRVYFEDLNVCVTGMSYGSPTCSKRVLERLEPGRVDAYNILLGYGGDREHMPFSKDVILEKGFNYVALGGKHKPTYVVRNRMAFSGSLEPLGPKELGKHGYIYGEVSGNGVNHIAFINAAQRLYVELPVQLTPELSSSDIRRLVEQKLIGAGPQNIYHILLEGFIGSEVEINLSELIRRYNVSELTDHTAYSYDLMELSAENEGNILAELMGELSREDSLVREDIRERAKRYALIAMLNSEKIKHVS